MVQVRERRVRAGIVLMVAGLAALALGMAAQPAFAATNGGQQREIITLKSGAGENGACTDISGQGVRQKWTFVVDHIYGDGTLATLNATFNDGTTVSNKAPSDTGQYSASWVVETAADAHLTNASADVTNANPDGAQLTLTSCVRFGAPVTTTTTVKATTTTETVAPAAVTTTIAPVILPRTGGGGMTALLGFFVLAVGGALLLIRKRSPGDA